MTKRDHAGRGFSVPLITTVPVCQPALFENVGEVIVICMLFSLGMYRQFVAALGMCGQHVCVERCACYMMHA